MVQVLEFIFSDVWHFLGVLVLMALVSTWHLINVDVTVIAGKIKDLSEMDGDEE